MVRNICNVSQREIKEAPVSDDRVTMTRTHHKALLGYAWSMGFLAGVGACALFVVLLVVTRWGEIIAARAFSM